MEVNKEAIRNSISSYQRILSWFNNVDVAIDLAFQDFYLTYYKIKMDSEVRMTYFSLLEDSKEENISYQDVLTRIYNKHGLVLHREASILIATRNPYYPLCEDYILTDLGIKIPSSDSLSDWIKTFEVLLKKFEEGIAQDSTTYIIKEFDKDFPEYKDLTITKKLDLVLYQIKDLTLLDIYNEIIKVINNK